MHRILLFAGSAFPISSFGFFVGLAILVGAYLNDRRRSLAGLDRSGIQDALVYAIVAGLVGARLLFILLNLTWYSAHPDQLLNTREGGISWYGAVAGGVLGLAWFCRLRRVSLAAVLDVFGPSLLAAHAIGRVGCLLNGCCYGRAADPTLPWAVVLRDAGHPIDALPRHPVQIYESLLDLLALVVLLYLERRLGLKNGRVFVLFLALYGAVRFTAEFWRDGDILWLGLTLAQLASLAIVAVALAVLAMDSIRSSPKVGSQPV